MSDLLRLLSLLGEHDYRFITTTPATHARVVKRRSSGSDLRDLLGWSLPVAMHAIPRPVLDALDKAGELSREGDMVRSRVRVSTCGDKLFLHSAYPTCDTDSVFFGPDSYRFVRFIVEKSHGLGPPDHLVDLGCGAGVGGIMLASALGAARVTLIDSNQNALRYARANAAFAGIEAEFVSASELSALGDASPDLIVANPPYMLDTAERAYRDGGGMHGAELSVEWCEDAAARLPPSGRFLLYSGSAIVKGEDRLRTHLLGIAERYDCDASYEEIDPDVFGEQLEQSDYADVERIAAIGASLRRRT